MQTKKIITLLSLLLFSIAAFGTCLEKPIESYYTVKDYGAPHFHPECLCLDQASFVQLIEDVNQKTKDRAFHIEVPNALYSENIAKLRAAQFFHYFDRPEYDSSIWCRTNGSGIPLVASHTFGARSIVYYKEDSKYFFLIVKDKYGANEYQEPGGYVQPDDKDIVEAFEKGRYKTVNLDYRSPEEAAINEVLEETGFDLTKYGYGFEGTKAPLTIGQIYTKNTRPEHGIHSVNNCCQFLLFQVTPNKDPLKKQDHEILDVRWASYEEIINNKINSPIGIHSTTDNFKILVQRVVAADKYKETRDQLTAINKTIQELLSSNDTDIDRIKKLAQEKLNLEKLKGELEVKIRQICSQADKKNIIYFTPL